MKTRKKISSLIVILALSATVHAQKMAYKLTVKIPQYNSGTVYLANHFGDRPYYADTAYFDKTGTAIFQGKKRLPGGIYLVVLPSKKFFEFVFVEPYFSLQTDTTDLVGKMIVKESAENKLFFDYVRFVNAKNNEMKPYQESLKKAREENNTQEVEKNQKILENLDNEIKQYRYNLMKQHPQSWVAKMFVAMAEPEFPEEYKNPKTHEDSLKRYQYFKQHFWDGFDFTDSTLVRTPIYHNKLKKYFEQILIQHPDTIIAEADQIIEKTRPSKDMFKYTVHYITSTAEKSKIMGMESVFVHMGKKYYLSKQAFWLDSANIAKFRERVEKLDPLLIGKYAPDLSLPDTTHENFHRLYHEKGVLTILVFWDPECGHCKKEIPVLAQKYNDNWSKKNIRVYAVSSNSDEKWKKFIIEHHLEKFTNVAVPQRVYKDQNYTNEIVLSGKTDLKSLNYHDTYDIYSTPVIYLLDENKKILAKRLDIEQLEKIIELELKRRQTSSP